MQHIRERNLVQVTQPVQDLLEEDSAVVVRGAPAKVSCCVVDEGFGGDEVGVVEAQVDDGEFLGEGLFGGVDDGVLLDLLVGGEVFPDEGAVDCGESGPLGEEQEGAGGGRERGGGTALLAHEKVERVIKLIWDMRKSYDVRE